MYPDKSFFGQELSELQLILKIVLHFGSFFGGIFGMSRNFWWRYPLLLFVVMRLVLVVWAGVVVRVVPVAAEADEAVRPYWGEVALVDGPAGALLGPWQRFDTMHYLFVAREGYDVQNSVFPPLYLLLIRGLGVVFRPVLGQAAYLAAALVISNLATLGLFLLFYRLATEKLGLRDGRRALLYLALFPTAFFLFGGYSESLFLLLVLGAMGAMGHDRPGLAGVLGFLAALTRLTGWVLVGPLLYEGWQRRAKMGRAVWLFLSLPAVGSLTFLAWRVWFGLPPIGEVYQTYWYQVTAVPGRDLFLSLLTLFTGRGPRAGEFTLWLDFLTAILLILTTIFTFRRLGATYGLYSTMLLLFMLLPASDLKPLYSFSRYALAFFPMFMVLAPAGNNPWRNRLILYPAIILYLYLSGQFFLWGWVA